MNNLQLFKIFYYINTTLLMKNKQKIFYFSYILLLGLQDLSWWRAEAIAQRFKIFGGMGLWASLSNYKILLFLLDV